VKRLALGSGVFGVNAYLLESSSGFVLVDTGMRSHRGALDKQLADAGCTRGTLKLIALTHGDFDHIGNAAYLRRTFGAPIALHPGDVVMGSAGDMFSGRKTPGWVTRTVLPLLARLPERDRFEPDVLLEEGADLAEYGLPESRVLLLRGHSSGSIALLLGDGSLFCGDVLENRSEPKLGSIMDDVPTAQASVERLKALGSGTVYPGHGAPFAMSELTTEAGPGR
jgi:glyoxylase-like metal-dependent hydrolase (beta-lactamase superfamily II)